MVECNKLDVEFNYNAIAERFMVFKFSTGGRFIKFGAMILDLVDNSIRANSIVFEKGNSFYALLAENTSLYEVRSKISDLDEADQIMVTDESKNLRQLPKNTLLKLLLNSLANYDHPFLQFNNLTGHLYLIHPDNLQRWRGRDNLITKVMALKIDVSPDMLLNLNVSTFTNLSLKNKLRFEKKKLKDYARYTIHEGKLVMRRLMPSDSLDLDKTYIIKQEPGKKSVIPFMNFETPEAYNSSKLGLYYELWKQVEERLNPFLSLRFSKVDKINNLPFSKSLNDFKNEAILKSLNKQKLRLIDTISDEDSNEFLSDLIDQLSELVPGLNLEKADTLDEQSLNIRLIHNKEYYEKYKVEDPYKNTTDSTVQHLTYEDFRFSAKAAINNVFKELTIKSDIRNAQITMVDWVEYGFDKPWVFVIKEDDLYYTLTVSPRGELEFSCLESDIFSDHKYQDFLDVYDLHEQAEGLVVSDQGHINVIEKTGLFTIPNFREVGKEFDLVRKPLVLSSKRLCQYLNEFRTQITDLKKQEQVDAYVSHFLIDPQELSRVQILKVIKDRSLRKAFSKWLFENTGELLHYYFRDQRRYELFEGNMDIGYWIDGEGLSYFVGEKSKGIQAKFPKASIIRNIKPYGDSELFFDKLIPTLNVDFVRNETLTVVPFPFKYLREFIKSNSAD